jgi:mannose-P-dolichol utilization defect protein 1
MSLLLKAPGIMALAAWVWGNDPDVTSPEHCLASLPWMPEACWSRLLVKALGLLIILGSFLNKLPIILNIWRSRSTAGLSRASVYGEIAIYLTGALYGALEGYPISAYGENVALTVQSVVIMLLIYAYTVVSMGEQIAAAAVAAAYGAAVVALLPPSHYPLLMAAVWPVQVFSRGSQIVQTFRLKHTGTQSAVTNGMNLAGSCIRIGTTIGEVGWDWAVLMGYALSVALNGTQLMQYVVYRENTLQFWKSLKDKKEE